MNIIAGLSVILYYLVFLLYYRWLLPSNDKYIWRVVTAIALITGTYFAVSLTGFSWLHLPILLIAMTIGGCFSSALTWRQSLYGAGVCTLSLYCFRGMTTAIGAWIVQDTLPGFALDAESYYGLTAVSVVIGLAFFQVMRKTFISDQELCLFLHEPSSMKNVIAYELAAIPCFILLNQGRYHNPDPLWFTGMTLAGSAFILFMLVFSIYHSIKETRLLCYKLSNQFMEEQMEIQLRYYDSYHKSTQNFRKLRHDYLAVMRNLTTLLEEKKIEQALTLIRQTDESLAELTPQQSIYSDNANLNAVLQDLEFNCKEHGIRLSCEAAVPRHTELTVLEALRIFTNVTNNAVDACKNVAPEDRFIKIICRNMDGWAMLHVINSFDGKVFMKNGKIKSRKNQGGDHGLGLSIVKEIAKNKGGLLLTEFDLETNTFQVKVIVPRHLPTKSNI